MARVTRANEICEPGAFRSGRIDHVRVLGVQSTLTLCAQITRLNGWLGSVGKPSSPMSQREQRSDTG
jgi:hypothetical protein